MFDFLLRPLKQLFHSSVQIIEKHFKRFTPPATSKPLRGALADLPKSKAELLAENALLRQQLLVLNRQVPNPSFQPPGTHLWVRLFLVILANQLKSWRQVLLIVKPDTLLKWHRAGFKLFW